MSAFIVAPEAGYGITTSPLKIVDMMAKVWYTFAIVPTAVRRLSIGYRSQTKARAKNDRPNHMVSVRTRADRRN